MHKTADIFKLITQANDEDFTLQIEINGKRFGSYIDITSLFADYNELKTDNSNPYSEFEPFSCTCGIAMCNGIADGIHLKARRHTIEWRIPKDSGYTFLEKSFFRFSRLKYETEIYYLYQFLKSNTHLRTNNPLRDITIGDWLQKLNDNEYFKTTNFHLNHLTKRVEKNNPYVRMLLNSHYQT